MINKFLAFIYLTFYSPLLFSSGQFNFKERIETRNYFLKVHASLFGKKEFINNVLFQKKIKRLKPSHKKRVYHLIKMLDPMLPENIIRPLVYWRIINPKEDKVADVLSFFMMYNLLVLRDHIDDPLTKNKDMAKRALKSILKINKVNTSQIFTLNKKIIFEKAKIIGHLKNDNALVESLKIIPLFTFDIKGSILGISPYSLSYLGIIPGNKVKLFSKNKHGKKRMKWFKNRHFFSKENPDFTTPYLNMPLSKKDTGHIAFKEDPIFLKIRDMIIAAKHTIFIDVYSLGGTIGATLAKFLLDQVSQKRKNNPNFKVLIIHDFSNSSDHNENDSYPIFKYIQKRISREDNLTNAVFLLQANTTQRKSEVQLDITHYFPKKIDTFKRNQIAKKHYFNNDHSKIIVIDANTDSPEAYFGSKNWNDHDGAYSYDHALWIKGPAAAVAQGVYYRDIEAALFEEEMNSEFSFNADITLKNQILRWFKIKRKNYSYVGYDKVRIAETNIDGKIHNTRNIIVDMIKNAKNHIYMEQRFLSDRYVVDALIKSKIYNPDLKIKILTDIARNHNLNGFPNTIFIKEMKKYGIEIRARKTVINKIFSHKNKEGVIYQKNNRNIISVDKEVLLLTSASLIPNVLEGQSREIGAQIWSKEVIENFEEGLLKDWNDPQKALELNIEDFRINASKDFLSTTLSSLINQIAAKLLRSKEKIEEIFEAL